MFRNVNLSNLKHFLQRNLRADRAWEYNFRAFGGTILPLPPPTKSPKSSGDVTDAWQELANLAIHKIQYSTKNYGNYNLKYKKLLD